MMNTKYSNIELSYVMPSFFNQENTGVLTDLLRKYAGYDKELMSRVLFILVDDHSPIPVHIPDDINLNIRLYRIDTDIMWNQGGARNLGAYMSPAPKLILSDADHYFPEDLLRDIIHSRLPRKLYKFKRVNPDGSKKHSACNIFYTSKGTFANVLGYDEEFCGHYGFEDVWFRFLCKKTGTPLKYFTRRKSIVSTDIDREHSYHSLTRDLNINRRLLEEKKAHFNSRHPLASHSRLFLNFNWHLAEERLQK